MSEFQRFAEDGNEHLGYIEDLKKKAVAAGDETLSALLEMMTESIKAIQSLSLMVDRRNTLIADLTAALSVSDKTLDCVLSPEVEGIRNWKEWAGVEDASAKAKAALACARNAGISPRFVKTDFDKDSRTKPGKPYRIVEAAPCNPAGEVIIVEVEGGVRLHSYLGPDNRTWIECDASGLDVRAAQDSYSRQLGNG